MSLLIIFSSGPKTLKYQYFDNTKTYLSNSGII